MWKSNDVIIPLDLQAFQEWSDKYLKAHGQEKSLYQRIADAVQRECGRIWAAYSLDDLRHPFSLRLEEVSVQPNGMVRFRLSFKVEFEACTTTISITFDWHGSQERGSADRIVGIDGLPGDDESRGLAMNRKDKLPEFSSLHPGEYVRNDILEKYGLSQGELAEALGVQRLAINKIVRGHHGVSSEMAMRLGAFTDTTPESWKNLQMMYDLSQAREQILAELEQIAANGSKVRKDRRDAEASKMVIGPDN